MQRKLGHRALATAVAAVFWCAAPLVHAAGPLKIMTLGDSITHGNDGYASYRYPLYYDLEAAGYNNFTFVGTQQSTEDDTDLRTMIDPATGQLAYPRYDIDFPKGNDGHSGLDSWYIAEPQNATTWAQAVQPDIVLLMAGTNDMLEGDGASGILQSYKDIAADLRSVNPHVAIVLAKLIPGAWCPAANLAALNSMIDTLPAQLSTPQSPFLVVDPYTNFNVSAYTFDSVHTNIAGAQFMANIWAPAVESLLDPIAPVTTAVWGAASDHLWSTAANWSTRSPYVPGDTATFAAAAGIQLVHLDTVRTAGYLVFGNAAGTLTAGWTLDNNGVPSNDLTLATPSGQPTITVNALSAGNVATISAAIAGTQGLLKTGAGTLVLSGANVYSGGTTVSAGALIFSSSSSRPTGDKLTLNKNPVAAQGTLVIIQGDTANLDSYRTQLLTGGITSTTATPANLQAIGYMDGASYLRLHNAADFTPGYAVQSTDVLLKYTYAGDANLDGRITSADYAQIDASILLNTPHPQWLNGDFNYDGQVNYKDYALIDAAYAAQSGSLADNEITAHAAEFGAPYLAAFAAAQSPAPEPAGLPLLVAGGTFLCLLKKRTHRII